MELFEIELFICIKIDLALNNLQRLIYHKTQTNIIVFMLMLLLLPHLVEMLITQLVCGCIVFEM